jgi:hypothetical protein
VGPTAGGENFGEMAGNGAVFNGNLVFFSCGVRLLRKSIGQSGHPGLGSSL